MKIIVDTLNIDDYSKILFKNCKIEIDEKAEKRVEDSYNFLKKFSIDKLIYGINTGFGPMAQYRVDENQQQQLQYNFIRSHATGAGNVLSAPYARSVMIARLVTLLRGYSGVHKEVPLLIKEFINRGVVPQIFEHGSVGASGDLVQLNHLTLNLIGEGELFYQGEKMPAKQMFEMTGLKPITMHIREALSLANGTSCMTGIGIINVINAKKILSWATIASVMVNEVVAAFSDYFSQELNNVKLHNGQRKIAENMRKIVAGSQRMRDRKTDFYQNNGTEKHLKIKVQEYYSLRCVPQVLGPVYDTIEYCENVLINELNSVSDNPIIDAENQNVFHGGNFHGDYIAIEMDKLKIAMTKLTMLLERQSNYLCHDKNNQLLPPFVNLGVLGLNYGMQALHFTATSTTAESQTLSNPMSVHSIPCNNDNQDVVSMGTNAALITRTVIENGYQVTAIHFMIIVQAIEYLKIQNQLSPTTRKVYNEIREIFPVYIKDVPMYDSIRKIVDYLKKID